MILVLLVVTPILLVVFGYFLWQSAMNNYGYNIFGWGVLIRLLLAVIACFWSIEIGIFLLIIFSLWNFITTWKNTSLFIALFSILFQPVALWFAFVALNKLAKEIND
ncbi:hypothetical protein WH52_07240 [Tenacibaculum holothuriorum]|uniref:Uncharacterized protein n=1 Tax=Tenacibaculum holothuriorum TaxID=1635173 RepID=A0A1Y2PDG8_9FLAO|nr:hypothetical protein [Tenacibaculum holothuriorum]OSY88534.1 hypothetical protein WH52_07240 [Tenacibaculum holothuriorum]